MIVGQAEASELAADEGGVLADGDAGRWLVLDGATAARGAEGVEDDGGSR